MFPETDLRNLDEYNSLLRSIARKYDEVDLKSFTEQPIFDYSGFDRKKINLSSRLGENAYPSERQAFTKYLFEDLEKIYPNLRKNHVNILSMGFDEILKNAHEHGNLFDSKKSLGIGRKFTEDGLELIVEDEGGKLEPEFLPYTSYLYDYISEGISVDGYYKHVRTPEKNFHSGSGLKTVFSIYDEVTFHKSDIGGLLVLMKKYL